MSDPINVTVSPIQTVNVQVNKQQNSSVRQLNYGIRTLKNSTDLIIENPQDGDAIIYQANTNSFILAAASGIGIAEIDAGFF